MATNWWQTQRETLLDLSRTQSPLYVYDEDTLGQRAQRLLALKSIDQLFYAIKANDHEDILRLFESLGLGFECVSLGELQHVFGLFPHISPDRVLFTPNFAPREEYAFAFQKKCRIILDSLYPLEHWSDLFSNQSVLLRLDPGEGRGHHVHVHTAGKQSKFGISIQDIPKALALTKKHHVTVVGLHAHAGSGIDDAGYWAEIARFLMDAAAQFDSVTTLDIGGGLSDRVNLADLDRSLQEYSNHQLWLEPGRYLVADAGVLLARVTQIKHKDGVTFIGVDTGMNSLIRPVLYGAEHPVVNLSRLHEKPAITAHIVGPICESGDTLGHDVRLPETTEGDIILIADAGAYGHVMASHYNRRDPAQEYYFKPADNLSVRKNKLSS